MGYEVRQAAPGPTKGISSLDGGSQGSSSTARLPLAWARQGPAQRPNGLEHESSHAKPSAPGAAGSGRGWDVFAAIGWDAGALVKKSCGVGPAKHGHFSSAAAVVVATSLLNFPTHS